MTRSVWPVRKTASVTVTEAVDGSVRRRSPKQRRARSSSVNRVVVDRRVMAAAKAAMRPGERLIILSPTSVLLTRGES